MAQGGRRDEGLVALGTIFMGAGAPGEALERFREAQLVTPGLSGAVAGELRALVTLHRFAEGREAAARVAACPSAEPDTLLLAGRVFAETEALDAAAQLLARAHAAGAERADVQQGVGDLARAIGDHVAAVDAYRRAVALDPDLAAVRVQLASLLRAQGSLEEAEQELLTAMRAVPTYADGALALASLQRELGRPADAVSILVPILEGNPYHLDALASLGESLFLSGRAEDARFAFARVLRFDAEHPAAVYFDGVFIALRRDYEGAIARWAQVIELEPAGEFAHRARRDTRAAADAAKGR